MDEMNLSFEVLKLMKRVTQNMKQEMHRRFGDLKLTAPQGMMVGTLAKQGPMKVSDLSEAMGLSNSTVSGIIDRLEKMDYLQRIRSEADRRIVMVDLTPAFREKSGSHFKAVNELLAQMIEEADPEEVEEIVKGLRALDRVILRYKGVDQTK